MKFYFILLITIFSRFAYGQANNEGFLRFDGFYESACYSDEEDEEGSQDYLRFYANGKVISIATDCEGTAEELKSWFNLNHEYVGTADYTANGRRLFYSTKSKEGIVKYKGRISRNGVLKLKWKSFINGKRGQEKYRFIPITGLAVVSRQ